MSQLDDETLTPDWWPAVASTARSMRAFTGVLLDEATPSLDGGVLRLTFNTAAAAESFETSRSRRVLESALAHHGVEMSVKVD